MTKEEKANVQALKTEIRESSGRVTLLKFDLDGMAKSLMIAAHTVTGITHGIAIDPHLAATMTKIPTAEKIIEACTELNAERARVKQLKASVGALGL